MRLQAEIIEQQTSALGVFCLQAKGLNTNQYWTWRILHDGQVAYSENSVPSANGCFSIEALCEVIFDQAKLSLGEFQKLESGLALTDLRQEIDAAEKCFKAFLSRLNLDTRLLWQQLNGQEILTVHGFNQLMGVSATSRAYRHQAMRAYPWLSKLLLSANPVTKEMQASIWNAIDMGISLEMTLATALSVPRSAIRRMHCWNSDQLFWGCGQKLAETITMLSARPIDLWPQGDDLLALELTYRWLMALELPLARDVFLRLTQQATGRFALSFRCLLLRDESYAAVQSDLINEPEDNWLFSYHLVRRYLRALERASSVPLDQLRLAFCEWLQSAGLKVIIDAALRWYGEGGGTDKTWGQLFSWCPITDSDLAVDDTTIAELCLLSEIKEEGITMQHCVADYAISCKQYGDRIFSIRNVRRQRIATLRIELTSHPVLLPPDQNAYCLAEIKGPQNIDAEVCLVDIAEKLLEIINAPESLPRRLAVIDEAIKTTVISEEREFIQLSEADLQVLRQSLNQHGQCIAKDLITILNNKVEINRDQSG